ncbi:aminotransferase class V-fold PLP-dependent enzyme [Fibrisoma montanum]|uniref:Aminotransferase class V-fold PLP-dependent enzyme n=1 Tax=Fibrisoma montanum TaxID=2305895 RepID=A0A418M4S9_9BACT|nr:aminotransferase class V-fold PLP-dependent enzyme [Fibrisoma montanum]RIV20758.1 aminotransferase class V-fold PLP-dependent enzyme [Fibrisoma montanum]
MLQQQTQLVCQKERFALPDHTHYINCATRGPFSRSVEQAGVEAIRRQINPFGITAHDFLSASTASKALFSQLIHNPDPERVAVIPSVSYGMAVVARNLPRKPGIARGQRIILIDGEFPSDVYAWQRVSDELGLRIHTVRMPNRFPLGAEWNQRILEAIDADTALVVVPPVHWMYGIRFDLDAIGQRAREAGAWLAVDGTQSVGALPFDCGQIRPDALICAGYKWLMGPYSSGFAYFSDAFDDGIPLEESWMARIDSDQFHRLTDYQPTYRPKAYRYNMGEQSHFIHSPMMEAALTQLLEWQPDRIQDYCQTILADSLTDWQELGCQIEPEAGRCHHLVGVWLPQQADPLAIQQALLARNVSVSVRARALRISPNVYNDERDVAALTDALKQALT